MKVILRALYNVHNHLHSALNNLDIDISVFLVSLCSTLPYYCGVVVQEVYGDAEYQVKFLRKWTKVEGVFVEPEVDDISSVALKNFVLLLSSPSVAGETKRQQRNIKFPVDFVTMDSR